MAEWIDNSIDHGAFREDTASALELVAMAASWELTLGFKLGSEIMGLNGVNPFNDQLHFLEDHPGKE